MTVSEKLVRIAENEQKVYNAGERKGYEEGYAEGLKNGGGGTGDDDGSYQEGYDQGLEDGKAEGIEIGRAEGYENGKTDGFEIGKQAEYDAFWDDFQQNGNRVNYTYAFANTWFDEIFKPKYNIAPTNADHMFFDGKMTAEGFKTAIEKGVTFDFSKSTNMGYAFASIVNLTEIPFDVSFEGIKNGGLLNGVFSYDSKLKTIKKIIVKETTPFGSNMFLSSSNIKNITIGGTIGENFSISPCAKLSANSIKNIIEHLSPSASGKTLTLSKTAVDNAEWDDSVKYIGTSRGPVYSNPISVPQGYKLKVELIVDDDHYYGTATWDDSKYQWPQEDPNYWYFALYDKGSYARNYIVDGGTNHTVRVEFVRHTVNDTPAIFSVRAVLVDNDGNEVGENLFSAVEVEGVVNNEGGWEALKASKPNWRISLV